MSRRDVAAALERAVEISRELVATADNGNVDTTRRLDAERLQLIKSARVAAGEWNAGELALLREIAALNDRALGFLEHRRRLKVRDIDMVSTGKRALRAYSATAY